jgi:hypothetical protein
VNNINAMNAAAGEPVGEVKAWGNIELELPRASADDSAQFRAALDRQMAKAIEPMGAADTSNSLGNMLAGRVTGLASEFQKDQQYVSKLLEQATRTGDSVHLMRAMLALNDYNTRVQVMSRTVAKAASSVDQLTKLQ